MALFRTKATAIKAGWIIFISSCAFLLACYYSPRLSHRVRRRLIYDYTTSSSSSSSSSGHERDDKRPIINKLTMAGVTVDDVTAAKLPTWSDVVRLYGPEPIISGLETCHAFRQKNNNNPKNTMITIGGQFNTGTSFLNSLLKKNCHVIGEVRSDVWWKHSPVEWSHNTAYSAYASDEKRKYKVMPYKGSEVVNDNGRLRVSYDEYFRNILPVVTIKDPYFWMQSMCLRPYSVAWHHKTDDFCPNLVPSSSRDEQPSGGVDVYGGTPATYQSFHRHYDSLIDYWNQFNVGHYSQSPFPHLMIRYEDLLFHTEDVIKSVCECAGGRITMADDDDEQFSYIVHPTKMGKGQEKINEKVGPPNGLVEAMIKYGNGDERLKGLTREDLEFARNWLDGDLMNEFHYVFP